jgi:hypothetical protein
MNNAESIEQKYRELQAQYEQLLEQKTLDKSRFQSQAKQYQSQVANQQHQLKQKDQLIEQQQSAIET